MPPSRRRSPPCPGAGAARQGAVAARPHRQDRRQAGGRGRRAGGRALGGRRRPRRDLFGGRRREGSRIVAGEWWPPDYRGPQLISFDEALASAFGLGARRHHHRERAGPRHRGHDRLAAADRMARRCRSISSSSISPGMLDKAPHTFLATVKATPEAEDAIFKDVTDQLPQRHRGAHPRRHRDGGRACWAISGWPAG